MNNKITLMDENGNEIVLEIIDKMECFGSTYIALLPHHENEEDASEEDELLIMEVKRDEEGQYFEFIRSEATYTLVLNKFTKRLSEYFDFD